VALKLANEKIWLGIKRTTERKSDILQFFHHALYEGMLSGRDIPFGARFFFG
jgi:hypothetical protein